MRALMAAVLAAVAVLLATPAHAQLAPLPAQPQNVAWPAADWPEGPRPDDLDFSTFDLAMTEAFAGVHEQLGETRAVVIVHRGRIVFERYGEGYARETRLISWSMAKSITHALVGAAVLQGRVDIDQPMGSPHWRDGDARAAITWRTFLTMTDGQRWNESQAARETQNDSARMLFGEGRADTARFAARQLLIHAPGERWNYNSGGSVLISDALTRIVAPDAQDADDRRARMRAWMEESLFAPIGMRPVVQFDPQGLFYGSSQIYATARDYARFGLLYLRDGVWNGRRILPEGWVDFARSHAPGSDIYGAHWWLTPREGSGTPYRALITDNTMSDAFSAQGHDGQVILIVPSKDLVIVRLGRFVDEQPESWDVLGDWMGRVAACFRNV